MGVCGCMCVCTPKHLYTHTHIHIYECVFLCVYKCVCILRGRIRENAKQGKAGRESFIEEYAQNSPSYLSIFFYFSTFFY